MIIEFFTWLNSALSGQPGLAITAALLWGVASILLSPCHLTSIPLILGYLSLSESSGKNQTIKVSFLFTMGIIVTIAILGFVTAAMGHLIGDTGPVVEWIIAVVLLIFGLNLMDVFQLPNLFNFSAWMTNRQNTGAFLVGVIFGIGLGPCTFAFMAPVLFTVMDYSASNIPLALAIMGCFILGHGGIIILACLSFESVRNYLNWTNFSNGSSILRKICGVLVILGAVYMVVIP